LTQDEDFLFDKPSEAIIVVSRVKQSRRLKERVELWRQAIRELAGNPQRERRFELMDLGHLVPWEPGPGNSWIAKLPRQRSDGSEDGSITSSPQGSKVPPRAERIS
jgi:hypothetical protein